MNEETNLQLTANPALLIASVSRCLIHYGSNVFNPKLIQPIKNDNWVKPKGGLWTSPINSNWGWKDWCESEDFRECSKENSFTLKLHDWAKICVIDSVSDLVCLPYYESYKRYLDFEKIAENYDAIWLTEKGMQETRCSNPDLYGWDCETFLILNPKCCYEAVS
jgi:hypothetical protein